jgi:ribosomal protein S18 acetylase RimI-like enzyme
MRSILVEGRRADLPTYYVHVGDLNWWLFYIDQENDFRTRTIVWERGADGEVIGWSLLSPRFRAFDLFLHPVELAPELLAHVLAHTEERVVDIVRAQDGTDVQTDWVAEQDWQYISLLEGRGFRRGEAFMWRMQRDLTGSLPEFTLPSGYRVRSIAGEHELDLRAAASRAAFESGMPIDRYNARYLCFMRSPVYDRELDLVVEAPDGRLAAFCIVWLDPVNGMGHFEPVGTHPDFRRRGLGKGVVYAGLRLLQSRGMAAASVCAESDNAAALRLYESAGFQPLHRLLHFVKEL